MAEIDFDAADTFISTASFLARQGLDRAATDCLEQLRPCLDWLLPDQLERLSAVALQVVALLHGRSRSAPVFTLPLTSLSWDDEDLPVV